ncbi:MAG: GTPase ObgE [Armatimonadetes bacterium]|nr:GTPase ObgE [Armatimonadota bacterium]
MSSFIDSARVSFESGKGGKGSASFHREKHVPRGGPNGADGGKGGNIVLLADRGKRTLLDFRLNDHYKAGNGTDAHGNKRGRDGDDLVVHVPVGTMVVRDDETIADLAQDGHRFVVAKGGRGGRGNLHFTSSVRQAPTIAENGEPAETADVRLELKLLADVGIVGLPNAGKSTLISVCSAAKPKIADYPFTTIVPNLGVVQIGDKSFSMADMPGLIEGASSGVGLGHQFLRHVERTKVLIHVVDVFPLDESDPVANFTTVESELKLYSEELAERPRVIALNKIDLSPGVGIESIVARFEAFGHPVFAISSAMRKGIDPLLFKVVELLEREEAKPSPIVVRPAPLEAADEPWEAAIEEGAYVVKGRRVERMVEMTNLSNSESLRYLHRRLQRMGVIDSLRDLGAEDGDTVRIGDWEFSFVEGG